MSSIKTWFAALNAVLGLWLLAVPFAFRVSESVTWNALTVGTLLVVLGGYNAYRGARGRGVNATVAAVNTLLGLWIVAAPFVLGAGPTVAWNDVVVGGFVALFAGYNALADPTTRSTAPQAA